MASPGSGMPSACHPRHGRHPRPLLHGLRPAAGRAAAALRLPGQVRHPVRRCSRPGEAAPAGHGLGAAGGADPLGAGDGGGDGARRASTSSGPPRPATLPRVSVVEFLPGGAAAAALRRADGRRPARRMDYMQATAEALHAPARLPGASLASPAPCGRAADEAPGCPIRCSRSRCWLMWLLLAGSASPGCPPARRRRSRRRGSLGAGGAGARRGRGCGACAAVPGLLRDVLVEVVRSNNAVARIILQPRRAAGPALRLRPHPARHAQPLRPGRAGLHPDRDARHGLGGLRSAQRAPCCCTSST